MDNSNSTCFECSETCMHWNERLNSSARAELSRLCSSGSPVNTQQNPSVQSTGPLHVLQALVEIKAQSQRLPQEWGTGQTGAKLGGYNLLRTLESVESGNDATPGAIATGLSFHMALTV